MRRFCRSVAAGALAVPGAAGHVAGLGFGDRRHVEVHDWLDADPAVLTGATRRRPCALRP